MTEQTFLSGGKTKLLLCVQQAHQDLLSVSVGGGIKAGKAKRPNKMVREVSSAVELEGLESGEDEGQIKTILLIPLSPVTISCSGRRDHRRRPRPYLPAAMQQWWKSQMATAFAPFTKYSITFA